MGLLETLIARVTRLEQQAGIVAEVAFVDEASETVYPAEPASPAAIEQTASTTGELDKFGVPYNTEFHATTKTVNQDGSWKIKRGCDKDAYAVYCAQFTPNAAASTPAAPATPTAPATPALPTMPVLNAPATPTAPALPVAPVAPVTPEAVKYIQSLTNEWKVPYATVVAALIAKHGATDFQSTNAQHHEQIKNEASDWCEKLALVDEQIERLDNAGNATGNGSGVAASVATVLQSTGGSQKLAEITPDKLDAVLAALLPFADQWVAYAQAQGKM